MRIRSPRGRCLRTPSGPEGSSGKWTSLGAAGSPGLSWRGPRGRWLTINGGCTTITFLLPLLRARWRRPPGRCFSGFGAGCSHSPRRLFVVTRAGGTGSLVLDSDAVSSRITAFFQTLPVDRGRHYGVAVALPQMALADLLRPRRPGGDRPHAAQRRARGTAGARLPLLRPARHRQDQRGAPAGEGDQLREPARRRAMQRVRLLPGDLRWPLAST